MSDPNKITKEDFAEIEAVVNKKLRNKKKKLEKIVATENKIVTKEIVPTEEQKKMVASKYKVEGQIKELEDMRKELHKECTKILAKHKSLKAATEKPSTTINTALGHMADALLINLLQNEYDVRDLLSPSSRIGLESLMIPIKSLFNPPADQLSYTRARECFIEVFTNFINGTEDIIPGSNVKYSELLSDVQAHSTTSLVENIPNSVTQHVYKLDAQETAAEEMQADEEEKYVETAKPQEKEWNKFDKMNEEPQENGQNVQEEEPTVEELVEEDVKKDMIQGKKAFMKNKEFIDEDGFTHIKPHSRSEFEHNVLRGRGRKGRKGRRGETDRLKVRGGKGPRGMRGLTRGGKVHHDKHDVDEAGRKTKTSHGKKPTWSKGNIRVDQPTE
jgi:hypothetical protein